MENKNKNIDKYFRESFGGYEQSPPDSSWEIIAKRMGKKRAKRIAFLTFKIAAGITLLFSLGTGIYMLTKSKNNTDSQIISHNVIQIKNKAISKDSIGSGKNYTISSSSNSPLNTVKESDQNLTLNSSVKNNNKNSNNIVEKETLIAQDFTTINSNKFKNNTPEVYYKITAKYILIPEENTKILRKNSDLINKPLTREEIIQLLLAQSGEIPETDEIKKQNWKLGGEIAPLYSDRSIKSTGSYAVDDYNDSESGIVANAGGIKVSYNAGRRLTVQSGIYYSRYGQQKNDVETYQSSNSMYSQTESRTILLKIKNSTGQITGLSENSKGDKYFISNNDLSSEMTITKSGFSSANGSDYIVKQIFDYFELPLVLKYKLIDGKFDFNLSGGIITNFLVGNKIKVIQNEKITDIGKTENINDINYQGSVGIGMEYAFSSNFELTLEPRFRYYLNSIERSSQIDVKPYSIGFFAGFNYKF